MTMDVSLQQLDEFAKIFWQEVKGASVFALHGEMGAGKTTITTALCRYKGVQEALGSPTFSIINEYSFSENGEEKKIFHIDLYRLKDDEEVVQAGVEDVVYSNELCFVEWPEKAPFLFDENTMHLVIQPVSETVRELSIISAKEYGETYLAEQL